MLLKLKLHYDGFCVFYGSFKTTWLSQKEINDNIFSLIESNKTKAILKTKNVPQNYFDLFEQEFVNVGTE